jgi:16S rRNA (adenine1518-N6/adenine1519-N6)-dimethyltransferase
MPLLTPGSINALLREHDVRPSRALGQNFLADGNTARRIVRLARLEPGDHVLEIGPGIGSLTLALRETGVHVRALELDRQLVPALRSVVGDDPMVDITQGDALEVDFGALLADAPVWRAVSNLPYNVATPVVIRLLEHAPMVDRMLVMVQREVGERMAAAVNSEAYGAMSVKVAYYATAKVVGTVPPTVFMPAPKVESALVAIDRRAAPPVDVPSVDRMFVLVRAGFAQRRKTLRQALKGLLGGAAVGTLEAAGIDPRARAETLGLDEWAALARVEAG